MSSGVDQPCCVQTNDCAQENAQHHKLPSAKGEKNDTESHDWSPEPEADPGAELVFAKIRNIRQQFRSMIVHDPAGHDPAHMRPQAAIARGVWIAFNVSVLMMYAMHCDPEERSAFQSQRGENRQEILNPFVRLVSTMRDVQMG